MRELKSLALADLLWLESHLSGGYWLGQVRTELNWRLPSHYDEIKRSVHPFTWTILNGGR